MQQIKNDDAATAQSMDLYTTGLLSLTQRMVDDTLWSEVGKLKTGASDESQIESMFSSNQALSSSLQAYDSAAIDSDPNNAPIAIGNFGSAWQSSIQGFDEVSEQLVELGSLPPEDSTDSTPPVSHGTPRGEPFSASNAYDEHTFTITGESDAAKVTSFSILPDEAVTLYVEGEGQMEISVPTALIEEIYVLLADDGEYVEFSKLAVTEDATTILFNVPEGASSIEMIGIGVVPEFPRLMLLLTLTLVLCSTVIAARYSYRK